MKAHLIFADLQCMRTNHSYQSKYYLNTCDMLGNSGNLSSLSKSFVLRKSKRDKRKRISQNRSSFFEKTGTSRYRSFAEKGIRDAGLIGLLKRMKDILHSTICKTRYTLVEPNGGMRYISRGKVDYLIAHYEKDLIKIVERLQKYSDLAMELVQEPDYSNIFLDVSRCRKACQDMCLPSFIDNYLFLNKVIFDVVHECIRFRLDYKPKVEPSQHSIRQVIFM